MQQPIIQPLAQEQHLRGSLLSSFSFSVVWTALTLSTSALALWHAWATRHQFYTAMLLMSNSKMHFVSLGNLVLFVHVLLLRALKGIFLGRLSEGESERLRESSKEAAMDTLLFMTVFRDEFDAGFVAHFVLLFSVKMFHWLAADRVEFMASMPAISGTTHVRTVSLLLTLLVCNALGLRYHVKHAFDPAHAGAVTVSAMFGFEFLLCLGSLFSMCGEYAITVVDLARGGRWDAKGTFSLWLHMVHETFRLVVYFAFFSLILTFYGFPLHIVRPMYIAMHSFRLRLSELMAYRKATGDMERRFPEALEADLGDDRKCIVCHCEMVARDSPAPPPAAEQAAADVGAGAADAPAAEVPRGNNANVNNAQPPIDRGQLPRKLPCGHILHFTCLREWLERQPTCPTCQRNVLRDAPGQAVVDPERLERRRRRAERRLAREAQAQAAAAAQVQQEIQQRQHQHRGDAAGAAQASSAIDRSKTVQHQQQHGYASRLSLEHPDTLLQRFDEMQAQLDAMSASLHDMRAVVEASLPTTAVARASSAPATPLRGAASTAPVTPQTPQPRVDQVTTPKNVQQASPTPTTPGAVVAPPLRHQDDHRDDNEIIDPALEEALRLSVQLSLSSSTNLNASSGAVSLGASSDLLRASAETPIEQRRRLIAEAASLRLSQQTDTHNEDDEEEDQ